MSAITITVRMVMKDNDKKNKNEDKKKVNTSAWRIYMRVQYRDNNEFNEICDEM